MEENDFKRDLERFVSINIKPNARLYDQKGGIPESLIKRIAEKGYLGCNIPSQYGGSNLNSQQIGLINELFARESPSVRSLFTVQGMVSLAICRWGTKEQQKKWLPRLASGEIIGAFALAEVQAGSDAGNISSSYTHKENYFTINANKVWVTFGQIAKLFLVFAINNGQCSVFLVEWAHEGIQIKKTEGLLGVRASMVASVTFKNCVIPEENILGVEGAGLTHIAPSCLDYGRFTVAWGCVGICQACLDYVLSYTSERKQFGSFLKEFQLIQGMLSSMIAQTKAARLMCDSINTLRDDGDPASIIETCLAKYFASQAANDVSSKAVQIFGANGCIADYPIERFYRDSKINEIIESTTQILEILIAGNYTGS